MAPTHRTFTALAALIALAGVLSCSETSPVGVSNPPIDVSFGFFNPDVDYGGWIGAEIQFTNRSDRPATFTLSHGSFYVLEVVDEKGRVVIRRFSPPVSGPTALTMRPRVVTTYTALQISSVRANMPDAEWYLGDGILPPGRYRLRGGLTRHWILPRWREEAFTIHER